MQNDAEGAAVNMAASTTGAAIEGLAADAMRRASTVGGAGDGTDTIEARIDDTNGHTYFYDTKTGLSAWSREELLPLMLAAAAAEGGGAGEGYVNTDTEEEEEEDTEGVALPEGIEMRTDEGTGAAYYYDTLTEQSAWSLSEMGRLQGGTHYDCESPRKGSAASVITESRKSSFSEALMGELRDSIRKKSVSQLPAEGARQERIPSVAELALNEGEDEEEEAGAETYDVTFDGPTLGITLSQGEAGQLPFVKTNDNETDRPMPGDFIKTVAGVDIMGASAGPEGYYNKVIELVKASPRPLVIGFEHRKPMPPPGAPSAAAPAPTPAAPAAPADGGGAGGGGGGTRRRHSMASTKALDNLQKLKDRLEGLNRQVVAIVTQLSDGSFTCRPQVHKAVGTIAQLNGNVDKLQFNGVDGIITADLTSARDDVKAGRKALNKACDELRIRINQLKPQLDAKALTLPATAPGTYTVTFTAPTIGVVFEPFGDDVVVLCVSGGVESTNGPRKHVAPGSILLEIDGVDITNKPPVAVVKRLQDNDRFPITCLFKRQDPFKAQARLATLVSTGVALKKGQAVRHNWTQRVFDFDVIKGELSYLKEGTTAPRGCVKLLHLSEVKVPAAKKYEHQLEISMAMDDKGRPLPKPFSMRFASTEEFAQWNTALQYAVGLRQLQASTSSPGAGPAGAVPSRQVSSLGR